MGASHPTTRGWANFYPLAPGNLWSYDRQFTVDVFSTGLPPNRFAYQATIEAEQTCVESIEGRSFQIERRRETAANGDEFVTWLRLRQDRDGLYEYDLTGRPECEGAASMRAQRFSDASDPATELAARVPEVHRGMVRAAVERELLRVTALRSVLGVIPSALASNEIQRLQYPLQTGAEWVLRDDPHITQRVEGADLIRTPMGNVVGYRIDLVWTGFFGPNDRVTLWYGRQGMLGLEFHLEGEATDASGNLIGTIVSEEHQTLTALHLENSQRFSATLP